MQTVLHAQEKHVEVSYTKLKLFEISLEACRKAGFVFTEKKQGGGTLLFCQTQADTLHFEKTAQGGKLIYASLGHKSPAGLRVRPGDGDLTWGPYFGVKATQASRWYFTDDTGCIEVWVLRKKKSIQRIVIQMNSCD